MTPEERAAQIQPHAPGCGYCGAHRAEIAEAIRAAVIEEREACLHDCDLECYGPQDSRAAIEYVKRRIRARGAAERSKP